MDVKRKIPFLLSQLPTFQPSKIQKFKFLLCLLSLSLCLFVSLSLCLFVTLALWLFVSLSLSLSLVSLCLLQQEERPRGLTRTRRTPVVSEILGCGASSGASSLSGTEKRYTVLRFSTHHSLKFKKKMKLR